MVLVFGLGPTQFPERMERDGVTRHLSPTPTCRKSIWALLPVAWRCSCVCVDVSAKQVFFPWASVPQEPPPCRIMGSYLCRGEKPLCAFIEYLLCAQELAVVHPAVTVTGAWSSSGQSEVSGVAGEGRSWVESGWLWLRHRARGWKGPSLRGAFSSTSSPLVAR